MISDMTMTATQELFGNAHGDLNVAHALMHSRQCPTQIDRTIDPCQLSSAWTEEETNAGQDEAGSLRLAELEVPLHRPPQQCPCWGDWRCCAGLRRRRQQFRCRTSLCQGPLLQLKWPFQSSVHRSLSCLSPFCFGNAAGGTLAYAASGWQRRRSHRQRPA